MPTSNHIVSLPHCHTVIVYMMLLTSISTFSLRLMKYQSGEVKISKSASGSLSFSGLDLPTSITDSEAAGRDGQVITLTVQLSIFNGFSIGYMAH